MGTGQSDTTYTINDPYYNRADLTNGYNNTFLSLGRYIPSHTDLSYLLLTFPPNVDVLVSNPSGQQIGNTINTIPDASYYLQYATIGPTTGNSSGDLKILTIPTPTDGTYNVSVFTTSGTPQQFTLNIFAYNTDGDVITQTLNGATKNTNTASFSIPYSHSTTGSIRGHLSCDPSLLKSDNSILHQLLCQVIKFFNQ